MIELRLKRMLRLCAAAALCSCAPAGAPRNPTPAGETGQVIRLANGRWFNGTAFVDRTMYSVGGVFTESAPGPVDSVVDLQRGYVLPPFAEAHNHNVDASSPATARAVVEKYIKDGVFYAQNPCGVLRARQGLQGFINVPAGLDATFSNACLTAPGGHPMGLYLRNLGRGAMLPTDSNSTGGFVWTIADASELDRKWPQILASHPDFIKVMLLFSEEYERRKADTSFFNFRGLSPALVREITERAHAAGLRVMAHIETATDYHNALVAGVDEIGHLPGFRGDERNRVPSFTPFLITDGDAALAARRGVHTVTTLVGAESLPRDGPDSIARRRLDSLGVLNLRMLAKHGAPIAIGSDSYRTTSVPEALHINSLGVFTPAELLRIWTDQTARAIYPKRRIGRLEPGYEASFIVLRDDPLRDFSSVSTIVLRFKQGTLLSP